LKDRFFANISHEFRTPLTMILGPVEDLLAGRGGPVEARARDYLVTVRHHARRMQHLVDQLLDLARLEAGRLSLQAQPADLVAFLQDTERSFISFAERKELTLAFQTRCEVLPLVFDADKLGKVVANLLSNAIKFTPSGGYIRIELSEEAETEAAVVRVRDTGPGIPKAYLARIFDRFYQVESASTDPHEGTGLGLALAKELVEMHGGIIEVTSEEGFGTEFTLRLPREALTPTEATEETEAATCSRKPTGASYYLSLNAQQRPDPSHPPF